MYMQLILTKEIPNYFDVGLGIYPEGKPSYYASYTISGQTIISIEHDIPTDMVMQLPLVIDVIGKSYTDLSQGVATYNLIYR